MTNPASTGKGFAKIEYSGEGYVPDAFEGQHVESSGFGTTRGPAHGSKLALSPMSNTRMGEHASVAVLQLASQREPTRKHFARRMKYLNQSGIFASTKSSTEQLEYEKRMAEIKNGYVRNKSNMLSQQMNLRMRSYANYDASPRASLPFSPNTGTRDQAAALQPGMQGLKYGEIPKLSLDRASIGFNPESQRSAAGDSLEHVSEVNMKEFSLNPNSTKKLQLPQYSAVSVK